MPTEERPQRGDAKFRLYDLLGSIVAGSHQIEML
jgi:hypothetical protein